ncbi:hypothetical protein RGI145_22345 [Roseomonas gilardii]|uniref:Tyr recombinase domain-containing protein n=1 Tax=Roseomonas gilardii TaxID=257708 RepID=A0A1L7AMU4_9PROT|nr:hypothetical protein RGI145_22345 [Roseomonas gilardii]
MPKPPQKGSSPEPKRRVVRKRLADGTVKEYVYGPRLPKEKAPQQAADTVAALLAAYFRSPQFQRLAQSTKDTYNRYLGYLGEIEELQVSQVRRRQLLTIRDAIAVTSGPAAANTFIRNCSALFSWARDRDWIDASPIIQVKALPGGHLQAWSDSDIQAALTKLPEHLRRATILALYTGQRRADLCAMLWSSYDGKSIRLTQKKTKVPLIIPVHPLLKAELDQWKAGATSVFILTSSAGRPIAPLTLSALFLARMSRIGLKGLNVHGLRKAAAARLADAGCSPHEIAAITGHKTLSMVELYTRSADQEKLARAAILKLEFGENANQANRENTSVKSKK